MPDRDPVAADCAQCEVAHLPRLVRKRGDAKGEHLDVEICRPADVVNGEDVMVLQNFGCDDTPFAVASPPMAGPD